MTQLAELGYRIEKMEKKSKKMESNVNLKRKKQILFLLKEKSMTAADIGNTLKLSRNRANEYLKVMEKEGIIKGSIRERKKYYSLRVRK
jgi:predicted ArsR family transcriptional regulator